MVPSAVGDLSLDNSADIGWSSTGVKSLWSSRVVELAIFSCIG